MEIPLYIIRSVYTHYRRMAALVPRDTGDYRLREAVRLSAKDIRQLEKYLKSTKDGKIKGTVQKDAREAS